MKKFIVFIITAIILSISAVSCGSKAEKDIKSLLGNETKLVSVKSIDIKDGFYQYTEEYNRFFEKNKEFSEGQIGWKSVKDKYETLFNDYPSAKQRCKKEYDESVKYYKEYSDSVTYYYNKCEELKKRNTGKIYVARLRGKNEYTNKQNEYCHYYVFAYNSDGNIESIFPNDDMRIIFSVFPQAKEDLKKAMGDALIEMADAFKNIDI